MMVRVPLNLYKSDADYIKKSDLSMTKVVRKAIDNFSCEYNSVYKEKAGGSSVEIPDELADKINIISEATNDSICSIIRECVHHYIMQMKRGIYNEDENKNYNS